MQDSHQVSHLLSSLQIVFDFYEMLNELYVTLMQESYQFDF